MVVAIILLVIASGLGGGDNQNQIGLKMIGTPIINIGNIRQEKEVVNNNKQMLSVATTERSNEAVSYSDFVMMYSDKRIQFNDACQATPASISFSVGDSVIFDNRSENLQAVRFIDDLYALPPLHVRVFKLTQQGIFDIDCGSSKNVAKIIVH